MHRRTAVKQICTCEDVDLIAGSLIFTSRALEAVGIYVHSMPIGPDGISTKPFLGLRGFVQ
ncbi:hypothetical protein CCL08_14210 [Pseudomonas congelans]|nr:hypothetical protein CCL08_14210 [Pseudomonas congelans]